MNSLKCTSCSIGAAFLAPIAESSITEGRVNFPTPAPVGPEELNILNRPTPSSEQKCLSTCRKLELELACEQLCAVRNSEKQQKN